ncbi:twin-arginine translocase TatA/TatE family subunit [Wolbachia endosymbiont of Onchocerca gibsoni]|uniref:Sec-independent protein translocase subunit TatB n=1 Tax=Wolbachia endosymbiont of Onchocerca gibsoni TaxID=118986 RepID=UPI0023D7F93F|nr:hypothetical protein [Wolbachia endosymbiont of Onchocerca gibsoni]MDF0607483.1 twin-arginine translocase TatA/TatE family subunit [Wolbachia endosymbiont of Onchocerca gibsoni]
MFSIGLPEILVVALVGIIVLDKSKVPVFISFIRSIYRYFIIIKSRTRNLLKNTGIEDLYYKKHDTEKVNYIVGKNGKFYPSYNIDNISKDNDSEDTGSR